MKNMDAYTLLLDTGNSILKSVCYGDDLESKMESDSKTLEVSHFRGINTSNDRLQYYDFFVFTNDEKYCIAKNRVLGLSKLSPTHALAYMDYIKRTTDFAPNKELPYFENHSLFETKN